MWMSSVGIPYLTVDEEVQADKEMDRRLNKNRDVLDLGNAAEFINSQM